MSWLEALLKKILNDEKMRGNIVGVKNYFKK
jgi:hypothetical protein